MMFHCNFLPIKAVKKPLQTLAAVKIPILKAEDNTEDTISNFLSFERAVAIATMKPEVATTNLKVSVENLYQSIGAGGVEKKNIKLEIMYGMKKKEDK